MDTICNSCKFDVKTYPVTVELDSHNRTLYCPVCGTPIDKLKEVPEKNIFYDEEAQSFIKWAPALQASTHPEVVEELTLGQLKIKVRAKTRDYRQIFYDAVLVFTLNDEIILSQVFAPPENCRRYGIDIKAAQLQPNETYLDVKFELKGGFKGDISIPAAATKSVTNSGSRVTTGSALMVWPNFKRPAWRHQEKEYSRWNDYFIYFASLDGSVKPKSFRIVGEEPGVEFNIADVTMPMGAVNFPPEYIEIIADVDRGSGTARQYKACFQVRLNVNEVKQTITNNRLHLSVDFGTSNTCFYYLMQGLSDKDPKPLKLNDKSHVLIGGLQLESDLRHTWIPNFIEQTLIPSELVFRLEPQKIFSGGGQINPIADYTIPPLKWRAGEERRISTGFKWQQATEPNAVSPYHLELQRMFLGLVFRLVMAELVSRDDLLGSSTVHPSEVELTLTYPLSMSEGKFKELLTSFEIVTRLIQERTGISLLITAVVDESRAGERGTAAKGPGQKIYIDIGGGTTDISVIEQGGEDGRRNLLVVDSLRYAGNDFLTALASDNKGGGLSTKPLIELQRRIRAEENVLDDLATFGNAMPRQEAAQKALDRFLRGLTQYLARIVAFRIDKLGDRAGQEKLIIYLLGNGWRFVLFTPRDPLASPTANPRDIIKKEVDRRLKKELENFRQAGIIKVEPKIELQHPEDPKTVVARGALLVERLPSSETERREPQTFMGSDIGVVTPTEEKTFRWNTSVPLDLGNVAENVYINNPLMGFELLRVPDNQHPGAPLTNIQDVNISQYLYERGRIVRSAFNLYLERWYKKYLTGSWI
jgi:hypothetical protein